MLYEAVVSRKLRLKMAISLHRTCRVWYLCIETEGRERGKRNTGKYHVHYKTAVISRKSQVLSQKSII